jgi:cytochrome oxidase Cu insertion factor (SCO1/SenC/PrrC family)
VTALQQALVSPAPRSALGKLPGVAGVARVRAYFASDSRRAFQTALGLLWLLDGALQFQPFMYSRGFVGVLTGMASGQPGWLSSSIDWAAHIAQRDLAVFNTLFALTQVLIGLGLLYRRTVKPALAASFAWALVVWWFGEGFGMLFAGTANPLTGAPGAVALYAIVGLLVWPGERPGGLLGVRGGRSVWATLWLAMAYLWLLGPNSGANGTANAIMMAPAGMSAPAGAGWLNRLESGASTAARGHGLEIALVLALLSAAIGVAVAKNWRPTPFLALAIVLSLGYWVIGQGFGGIFYTGSATDPNTGPVLVLLALVLYSLTPVGRRPTGAPRPAALLTPLLAIVAVGVAAAALATSAPAQSPIAQPVAYGSPFDGQAISPPVPAPPISLRNYLGDPVTLSQYQGQAVLVTFVSTRCPAVCALIASELRQAFRAMPRGERRRLQIIAVSVDPRSDTPTTVGAFLRRAGITRTPTMHYLIGSRAQLRPIWREWGLSGRGGAGEMLNPVAVIYGISAAGEVMTSYSEFFTPQQIVHDAKRLEAV